MENYSVLMSLYIKEKPEYLELALDSMLNQTLKPNEIVIVKDGEITKELEEVLNKYEIKYPDLLNIVGYKKNRGLGFALNFGLQYCKNELIARMDTDDISEPTRCEEQIKIIESDPKIDIIGGNISEFISEPDNIVAYRNVPEDDVDIKEYLKKRCPFNHMTVMFRKSAVLVAGGYKELFWNEDYYLWIRMFEKNITMKNTGTVLVNVRTGTDMYKRRGGIQYFKSEKFLQKYMLEHNIINTRIYLENIIKRFIVQCLLPNSVRGFIFKKIAREKE